MASKYGMQLYGKDLYSSAITGFTGATLSVSVTMSGRLSEVQSLVGTIPVVPAMSGRLGESEPLVGTIPVTFGMSTRLSEIQALKGTIPLSLGMAGILRENNGFVGGISVPITFGGRLGESEPLVSASVISVTVTGRATRVRTYSYVRAATSKYGNGLYGGDAYSRAEKYFIQPVMNGVLKDTNGLNATLPISIDLDGSLWQSATFVAVAPISITIKGSFAATRYYSHVYTGISKYGIGSYSNSMYSRVEVAFIQPDMDGALGHSASVGGTLSVWADMNGVSGRTRTFQHIYAPATKYGMKKYGRDEYASQENIFIRPIMGGNLNDSNAFVGGFAFELDYSGILGRNLGSLESAYNVSIAIQGTYSRSRSYSHIYTGISKYGVGSYGNSMYSRAEVAFIQPDMDGSLSYSASMRCVLPIWVDMDGVSGRIRTFEHFYVPATKYGMGKYGRDEYASQENIFIRPIMGGNLSDINAFVGGFALDIDYSGALARDLGSFTSDYDISITINGKNTRIRTYEHFLTDTTKYGTGAYGQGAYERAFKAFIRPEIDGSFARTRLYSHLYVPVTNYGIGAYGAGAYANDENPFIRPIMGGALGSINALVGYLGLNIDLIGELELKGLQHLAANMLIAPVMLGGLMRAVGYEGVPLQIIVNLFGDLQETDGFWVDDNPVDEEWLPDVPSEPIWTPDAPIGEAWGPTPIAGRPWTPVGSAPVALVPSDAGEASWTPIEAKKVWVPDTPNNGTWGASEAEDKDWVEQDSVSPPWVPIDLERKKNG